MCPVCLAMGLYVAGGASVGGITTYLAAKVLRRRRDQDAGDHRLDLEASKLRDGGAVHDGRRMDA